MSYLFSHISWNFPIKLFRCSGHKQTKGHYLVGVDFQRCTLCAIALSTQYLLRPPDRRAECYNEHVCLRPSVCLSVRDHISGTTRTIFTKFFVHVTYGCGPVFLWQRNDMLCTSGFMDDVIFAHKPRLLDVVAQQKCSAHAALSLALRRNTSCRPTDARNYFSGAWSNFPGCNTGGGVCVLWLHCL